MNRSIEEVIRNKQLVGQTANVVNLPVATRPAVVTQNMSRPFNWQGGGRKQMMNVSFATSQSVH